MGLDMYLEGEVSLADYRMKDEADVSELRADIQRRYGSTCENNNGWIGAAIAAIVLPLAYWRKANAVHRWFVQNVQGGEDECQRADVSLEQLVALRYACRQVLDDHKLAKQLLPTQDGFFFGTTEYDDDYFADLTYTEAAIQRIEKNLPKGAYIYYHSSW